MKARVLVAIAAWGALTATSVAWGQRGMGDSEEIVRQGQAPPVEELAGTLEKLEVAACQASTGRGQVGVHLLLRTENGELLNVHVGPARRLAALQEKLPVGKDVVVAAFRTEKMPGGHYVAREVRYGDEVIVLRGKNPRPLWAGPADADSARSGPPAWAPGFGSGCGRGYGPGCRAGYGPQSGWAGCPAMPGPCCPRRQAGPPSAAATDEPSAAHPATTPPPRFGGRGAGRGGPRF